MTARPTNQTVEMSRCARLTTVAEGTCSFLAAKQCL
jgi:hypothetical protein